MSYTLEFEITGLPKMHNQITRGHWTSRHKHNKEWKMRVFRAAWHLKPSKPLNFARLTLTRVSSVEGDFDGIASSFKPIIDGLVEAGVLVNDRQSNIGQPTYIWQAGKRGRGRIKVKVEAIAEIELNKSCNE